MRTDKQFSFVGLKISSIIPSSDPLKILFDSIDFSFIYDLAKGCYGCERRKGTTIEGLFSIMKGSHSLEDFRVKGIKNVSIHVFMTICDYMSRLIAGLKLKTGLLAV